jgi:DNA-binding NarL/FixJ family response regulator
MTSLRILIADDHEVVRRGVTMLLESRPGWEVVGEAGNGREAVDAAKRLQPDVVILDVGMPELNGIEATRQILEAVPGTEVLVLTMHQSENLVRRILQAGALGYVSKSDVASSLGTAVDAVSRHTAFLSASPTTTVVRAYLRTPEEVDAALADPLTQREREVLQLIAEGKSNKEVATTLGISAYTAETHRRNIMQKLNLHSVGELIRYAVRNQLVTE